MTSLLQILVYVCIIRQQSGAILRITSKNLKFPETIPENLKIINFPVPSRGLYQSETWQEIEAITYGPNKDATYKLVVRFRKQASDGEALRN